ncbi:hypothetical protein V8F06_006580 [Rhypophila decipiens]
MRSHPYTAPPPLPPLLDEIADELVSILPNQGSPRSRRTSEETEFELGEIDPETSRLVPAQQKRHHVRIQGKLVLVRSVSTANLRSNGLPGGPSATMIAANKRIATMPMTTSLDASSKTSPGLGASLGSGGSSSGGSSNNLLSPRHDPGVGASTARLNRRISRRQSYDGSAMSAADDDNDDEAKTEAEVRETIVRDRQLRGYGIGGAGNIRRPTEVIHFPERRGAPSMLLFSSVLPPSPSSAPSTPTTPTTADVRRKWNLREMFGLTPGGERKGKTRASPMEQ